MEIGGGVDDEDEEEFYDSEPLPILGRCKSLYPFEGKYPIKIYNLRNLNGILFLFLFMLSKLY